MLPRTLRNFSLFIDGQGFAGRVTECTLPTLEINLEEYRAGVFDAPVEIDQGMSALEAEFTLAEYDPEVIKLFGLYDQNAVQATIRGPCSATATPPLFHWSPTSPATSKTSTPAPWKLAQ